VSPDGKNLANELLSLIALPNIPSSLALLEFKLTLLCLFTVSITSHYANRCRTDEVVFATYMNLRFHWCISFQKTNEKSIPIRPKLGNIVVKPVL